MANKIPSDTQWADLASKIKAKQDALSSGAGINIANNTVGLDYLTLANGFKSWSGTKTMTTSYASVMSVDISDIPTGADFAVFATVTFTGSSTVTAASVRFVYNSTNSDATVITTSWGRTVTVIWKYTKVAGENSVAIHAKKDNSSTINATNCVCLCMQAGKWIKGL